MVLSFLLFPIVRSSFCIALDVPCFGIAFLVLCLAVFIARLVLCYFGRKVLRGM